MKTRARSDRSGRIERSAFTLIELMVVITIMVALMALTAAAVLKFLGVQQTSNTQSYLDRVQSQLIKAWSKVKDSAKNETVPPTVVALAGTDANANGRARVIYLKLKLRQAFPMNFGEALNVPYNNPELAAWGLPTLVPPSPVPAWQGYFTYLTSLGITPALVSSQAAPQPYESSVCLLMALQRGVSGAGIDPADLTAGGAAGSFMTPSGGNLPYLNDAWGRPIFFSRVPSGCPLLNPSGPLPGANDPGDPQGLLTTPQWVTNFGTQFAQLTLQPVLPSASFKLAPMLASGGPSDWTNRGTTPTPASSFDPITFAPVPGSDALFSTP